MLNNLKVHNVVASGSMNTKLPLSQIAMELERAEYEPEQFPGLVYRLTNPKAAALLFNSGKIVCTGTKSVAEAHQAIDNLVTRLRELGVEISGAKDVKIQNMVASTHVDSKIDLNKIAFELEGTEYEPEQFPGLVYRLDDPKVVFLIFQSGKVICTGGKNPEMIEESIIKLEKNLKEIEVI
ncbi:MAG: TATA-box-binding protein [Candidatus Aenigmarchaeota archaeon]|nr:TATA-box-binding protein [Candidatus Aenigmarchaeota archaeon]